MKNYIAGAEVVLDETVAPDTIKVNPETFLKIYETLTRSAIREYVTLPGACSLP